ncbi:MAG: hypothetical protein LLG04_02640 [Parachlamydia sp.]|nr:hypothetical protein [Parachlamydia sp.]
MAGTSVQGAEAVKETLKISNKVQEKACIMAFTKEIQGIQNSWGSFKTIICTAYFQCSSCKTWCYKGKCSVSCGHWHLLQFTSEESADLARNKDKASINLMDHFQELVPNHSRGKVGLVTYQNGINNTYADDFNEMGETIKSFIPEGPLCVGFYNQSSTIVPDLARLQCEFFGVRTEVVRSTRKMFTTLTNRLRVINPHPLWLHICHSEGGLIAHDTLGGLEYGTSVFCQNHLLVHTYGAVQPIPKRAAKIALNTYATHDIAYRMYGVKYENRSDYEINVVSSEEKPSFIVPGDHGFLGSTYPIALKRNMNQIREKFSIYDAKK